MGLIIKPMWKTLSIFLTISPLATSIAIGQIRNPAIREELVKMEKVDQDARLKCSNLSADEQLKCLADTGRSIDTEHKSAEGDLR